MAQSVGEARKVWLAIEQSLDHPDNAFAISQAAVSSSVCHVDFRGPKSGGFVFGAPRVLKVNTCCSDAFHHTTQAIRRLRAAGGQAHEVDWDIFEQAKEAIRDLSSLAAAETVSMKAILGLQAKHMKLSHQAANVLETVDVLFLLMTACLSHSASGRTEQNSRLIDSMNICSIRLAQP